MDQSKTSKPPVDSLGRFQTLFLKKEKISNFENKLHQKLPLWWIFGPPTGCVGGDINKNIFLMGKLVNISGHAKRRRPKIFITELIFYAKSHDNFSSKNLKILLFLRKKFEMFHLKIFYLRSKHVTDFVALLDRSSINWSFFVNWTHFSVLHSISLDNILFTGSQSL